MLFFAYITIRLGSYIMRAVINNGFNQLTLCNKLAINIIISLVFIRNQSN